MQTCECSSHSPGCIATALLAAARQGDRHRCAVGHQWYRLAKMRSSIIGVAPLLVALTSGCADDSQSSADGTTGSSDATTTAASVVASEDGQSDGQPSADSSGGESEGGLDDGSQMGECSLFEQDCPDGDKCSVWSDEPDLTPDDIRCCPEVQNGGLQGEACSVQDYLGSCIDDCAEGHMCLDIDGDGMGQCERFCGGNPDNPECDFDETCFIYFSGVPFCFPQCDPLVQDCVDGTGCYPDDSSAGTGFICMPTVGGGNLGDPCWLLSNCEPGFLCLSPDFVPDCPTFAGCCTSLCDVTETDTCDDIVTGTECVSWYYAGQTPPSADLQNVGACVIPP